MSQNTDTDAKRLTTKHVVLILGTLIILCAAVLIAIFLLKDNSEPAGTSVITESNLADIKGEMQAHVDKGMFMTHMNTTWIFPDGKSPSSNAIMGNAAANNYPFWFTLTLPDTDETLFKSGLMPLGTQLSELKLDKDLDKGTYDALVTVHMVDEEGKEMESNMSFNVSLIVEN